MAEEAITLSKYELMLNEHASVSAGVNSIVQQAVPMFKVHIALPDKVTDTTPQDLFSRAAVIRGYLDRLTTVLSGVLILRLQVKNASKLAQKQYKDRLGEVYNAGHESIKKARGFEEKELLARAHIEDTVKVNKDFWETTLSNLDDTVELMRLKMRQFRGGLDTILSQIALLKIQNQYKGITGGLDQFEALRKNGTLPKEEGEVGF